MPQSILKAQGPAGRIVYIPGLPGARTSWVNDAKASESILKSAHVIRAMTGMESSSFASFLKHSEPRTKGGQAPFTLAKLEGATTTSYTHL